MAKKRNMSDEEVGLVRAMIAKGMKKFMTNIAKVCSMSRRYTATLAPRKEEFLLLVSNQVIVVDSMRNLALEIWLVVR